MDKLASTHDFYYLNSYTPSTCWWRQRDMKQPKNARDSMPSYGTRGLIDF